jgi:hypothetical protein
MVAAYDLLRQDERIIRRQGSGTRVAATHENSAYLRVALGPAQAVARPADEIEGAWHGAARDECLGDYEECHTDEERDCHAEDDKPENRQDARSLRPGGPARALLIRETSK